MNIPVHLHPGLRALLEFEQQRLGLPLQVRHQDLTQVVSSRFRPVLDVVLHMGPRLETLDVRLDDHHFQLRCPVGLCEDDRRFGFLDRHYGLYPLAGVTGNQVHVYYDLDWVFRRPWTLRPVGSSSMDLPANPLHVLAEVTLTAALQRAARNIRQYDWRQERGQYLQYTSAARIQKAREWSDHVAANERSIQDKVWEIRQLVSKNRELRDRLRHHQDLTLRMLERRAAEDHDTLVKMVGKGLRDFEVDHQELRAITEPIDIHWNGMTYDLGSFELRIPVVEGSLLIHQRNTERIVEGYPHPHINSQGVPCLGNIAITVGELLGEGRYGQLVILLLEFLRSYNEDNPYLRLERWDPDWEDDEEDRFESCYREATLKECATCGDYDCPYHDGAQRRCYENTDTKRCIECGECDLSSEATDQCREDHERWECVSCTRECAFAGDEYACYEGHEGQECPTCDNNQCAYHGEHHERNRRVDPAVSAA